MTASIPSLGQVAFEAYCKATSGRSLVSGDRLPTWDKLKPEIQHAWEAAGQAAGAEALKQKAIRIPWTDGL
jgi:hypothetical protein